MSWKKVAALAVAALVALAPEAAAQSSAGVGDYQPGPGYITSPAAPAVPRGPDPTDIYRDSEHWAHLEAPGGLMPGGRIVNITKGSLCSVGFMVLKDGRRYVLTAGHCGNQGDEFGYFRRDPNTGRESVIPFGRMVFSYQTADYASVYGLIDAGNAPYLASPFKQGKSGAPLAVSALPRYNPPVCRLGFRSGLSCGGFIGFEGRGVIRYYAIADHGDSGGPVYALINGKFHPVGMTSYGYTSRATQSFATPLAPIVQHFGLTVLY
ncbi:hypothetical protein [Corynebacterium aquilae]|uniref:Peptidase S1 domain-containing protein n=1 Tax=Corynebacterium aquilae DSM 44791 TaxID=1431546 RepID=A0A1L7CDP6_9CORY|nr:hypothetical protein [Corynebacterium aquilae]APT83957.1 hypothetical protein CAQU_01460 [Corynebacterium aquilae DSM 44791]